MINGRRVPAAEAVARLGTPLQVITAWNPVAVRRTQRENTAANAELRAELETHADLVLPATGRSISADWHEDGFVVVGQGRRWLRRVGRHFGQLAFFSIDRRHVTVVGCGWDAWDARRPLDIRNWPPPRESDDDLSSAIVRSLGLRLRPRTRGATEQGWVHEGGSGLACPRCGAGLEVFGCEPPWPPSAAPHVRRTAVVCAEERAMVPTRSLSPPQRDAIDAWREYRMARTDADRRRDQTPRFSVYCIELKARAGDDTATRSLYVGQTIHAPEVRLAEHLAGGADAARAPAQRGVRLLPELTADLPPLRTRSEALAVERWLHHTLAAHGWDVHGDT